MHFLLSATPDAGLIYSTVNVSINLFGAFLLLFVIKAVNLQAMQSMGTS